MIEKEIQFFYEDHNKPVIELVHPGHTKLASMKKEAGYSPELAEFIDGLKEKADRTYALVNALSAMEYYGCFFKGQHVLTRSGYKFIEDISEGELVWTHTNGFKPVLKTFKKNYSGIKVSINIQNMPECQESNANHPFLVLKKEDIISIRKSYYKQKITRDEFLKQLVNFKPSYISAKDIEPGDYVFSPIKPKVDKLVKQLPMEYAYLFGYYLSEGCLAKEYRKNLSTCGEYKNIIFSMSENDKEMINKLDTIASSYDRKLYISQSKNSPVGVRLKLGWKEMANLVDKYFGHHSRTKYIHPDIFMQSDEWITTFLAAYLDGDGCLTTNANDKKYENTIKFSTASRRLSLDLQRLFASVGIVSTINKGMNKFTDGCFGYSDHVIYEGSVSSSYTQKILEKTLRLKFKNNIFGASNGGFFILPNGYALFKVKSVTKEEIENTDIYNLEVKDDNTYVVDFIGHNSNKNGDAFPEKALRDYHKTFEALAGIYRHHNNKDQKLSMGRISFAHYNPKMHRVELILELINEKAKDILSLLANGSPVMVSMGTRVPQDFCSICNNAAKTRAEYCDHLKYQMGEILPSGKKVYAINMQPKFFDLSIVKIPADPTASFLKVFSFKKEAAAEVELDFNQLGRISNKIDILENTKIAELHSEADIKKVIPAKIDAVSPDPKQLILQSQKRLTQDQIEKLSDYSFDEVLSTFLGLRILPVREDFQKLALYCNGYRSEADDLVKAGFVFSIFPQTQGAELDVSLKQFSEKIAEVVGNDAYRMSLVKPLVISRILEKIANSDPFYPNDKDQYYKAPVVFPGEVEERSFVKKFLFSKKKEPRKSPYKAPIVPLGLLGALYIGYAKTLGKPATTRNVSQFRNFMLRYPWLAPVFVAATGTLASLAAQKATFGNSPVFDPTFQKTSGAVDRYVLSTIIAAPVSYYASAVAEEKAQRGIPLSSIENAIRKHPMFFSIAGGLAGGAAAGATGETLRKYLGKGKEFFKASSFISKLPSDQLDDIWKLIIDN